MARILLIVAGVIAGIVMMPLIAALLARASRAALDVLPSVIIIWFVVAVLQGMVRSLFR